MDERAVHSSKALPPIIVTDSGIVIDVRDEHASNASHPILVIDSGIVIDASEVQKEYLQPIITQYFISNKSEIWS